MFAVSIFQAKSLLELNSNPVEKIQATLLEFGVGCAISGVLMTKFYFGLKRHRPGRSWSLIILSLGLSKPWIPPALPCPVLPCVSLSLSCRTPVRSWMRERPSGCRETGEGGDGPSCLGDRPRVGGVGAPGGANGRCVFSLLREQELAVGPPLLCPAATEPELETCLKQPHRTLFYVGAKWNILYIF